MSTIYVQIFKLQKNFIILTKHIKSMGFRPYASERLPTIGLVKNCRKLYIEPRTPPKNTEIKRSGAPVNF